MNSFFENGRKKALEKIQNNDFNESDHPRKGGKFVKKGSGGSDRKGGKGKPSEDQKKKIKESRKDWSHVKGAMEGIEKAPKKAVELGQALSGGYLGAHDAEANNLRAVLRSDPDYDYKGALKKIKDGGDAMEERIAEADTPKKFRDLVKELGGSKFKNGQQRVQNRLAEQYPKFFNAGSLEPEYIGKNGLQVKYYMGAWHVQDASGKEVEKGTFWTLSSAKARADQGR